MLHFLHTATAEDWAPFKRIATEYATNKQTPSRRLKLSHVNEVATSDPRDLAKHVVDELNSHNDPERESLLGGGISDVIHTIGHTVAHGLGIDRLSDFIFGGPVQKERSHESEVAAFLVKQTYMDMKDRPVIGVDGYQRLAKYDSDFYSVWQKPDGELLVTIRGTKDKQDVFADVKLLVGTKGGKLESLDPLLDRIERDFPGVKYSAAAHSLGTSYLLKEFPEHRDNMNEVYLYNVASSPAQSKAQLQNIANQNAQYYVNASDLVSAGAYQNMSRETLDNVYLGDYKYSPLAAHSLTQWYNADEMTLAQSRQANEMNQETKEALPTISGETAQMRQDTQETREAGLS